jgi:hypothetical protein
MNRDFPFELMFMIQLSFTGRFRDYPSKKLILELFAFE